MSEDNDTVREAVRARYASAALAVTQRDGAPAVSTDCCGTEDAADAAADCCGPAFVDESLVFGSALGASIAAALRSVHQRDFPSHGAWMIRA